MPKPFTICLWFDHQAEDAAKFYTKIFKGKIGKVTRFVEGSHGKVGAVMTAEWKANGLNFVGINGGPLFKFSEAVSLQVFCKTQREIDAYWKKLQAGGGAPSQCGWLKDKFGFSWQVTPEALPKMLQHKDKTKAKRATEAMLKMQKLDLKALQKAFDGK